MPYRGALGAPRAGRPPGRSSCRCPSPPPARSVGWAQIRPSTTRRSGREKARSWDRVEEGRVPSLTLRTVAVPRAHPVGLGVSTDGSRPGPAKWSPARDNCRQKTLGYDSLCSHPAACDWVLPPASEKAGARRSDRAGPVILSAFLLSSPCPGCSARRQHPRSGAQRRWRQVRGRQPPWEHRHPMAAPQAGVWVSGASCGSSVDNRSRASRRRPRRRGSRRSDSRHPRESLRSNFRIRCVRALRRDGSRPPRLGRAAAQCVRRGQRRAPHRVGEPARVRVSLEPSRCGRYEE